MAFKTIIQAIRREEIKNYIWLSLGRAIERALSFAVSLWGCYLIFLVASLHTNTLDSANAFSTL